MFRIPKCLIEITEWVDFSCKIRPLYATYQTNNILNQFHATVVFLYHLFLVFSGSTERDQWQVMG